MHTKQKRGAFEVALTFAVPERLLGAATSLQRERARALLNEQETAYLDRCRHPRRRDEFLCGRALLRASMWREFGRGEAPLEARSLNLEVGSHGRPECSLERAVGVYFNLSHTSGLLVVACAAAMVGVDLEDRERKLDQALLAKRHFTESEQRGLRGVPSSAQSQRFFELWTLKEAYMKARGMGFSLPSRSFEFELSSSPVSAAGRRETLVDGFRPEGDARDEGSTWSFQLLEPTARHQLGIALCSPKIQRVKSRWTWGFGESGEILDDPPPQ